MSDDAPPPKRKLSDAQLAALRANRLNPKRAQGRPPKRSGPAYRKEARTVARLGALNAQRKRREAKLADAPPDLVPADPADKLRTRTAAQLANPGTVADVPELLEAIEPADPARPKVRYSRMMAEHICDRIARGEPLQEICAVDGMPTTGQVLTWARTRPEFRALYDEARVLQADYIADLQLGLAQKALDSPKDAAGIRVAADILAKQAEWRAPRKFGPRMDLTVTEVEKTPDQIRAEALALQEDLGIPEDKRIH